MIPTDSVLSPRLTRMAVVNVIGLARTSGSAEAGMRSSRGQAGDRLAAVIAHHDVDVRDADLDRLDEFALWKCRSGEYQRQGHGQEA